MEFDEMKKVWDSQTNQSLYVINEAALHKTIKSRRDKGAHITNITELISIVVNLASGAFLFTTTMADETVNVYLYILATWMVITGIYCLFGRVRRIKGDRQFDRTMLGDLNYAVAIANYQVHFSALMRWNIIPIGILISLGMWKNENSTEFIIGLILFFALTFYASGWEHRYYKSRRRDLEELRRILVKGE